MTYDSEQLFEDDPALGRFGASYPADRLRLLAQGAAALLVIYFVTTVALWQLDDDAASIVTVIVIAIATLLIGWYVTHFWNREIVCFERGFHYREGSKVTAIAYSEIVSIRQQGARTSYFGGLVRRNSLTFVMQTAEAEIIRLDRLYRRLEELTLRLEQQALAARMPLVKAQIKDGKREGFSATLKLGAEGLYEGGRYLPWAQYGGYRAKGGQLVVLTEDNADWYTVPLADVDNIRLLLALLEDNEIRSLHV